MEDKTFPKEMDDRDRLLEVGEECAVDSLDKREGGHSMLAFMFTHVYAF